MHIDDHGFGTSIKVVTGSKYWVLASNPTTMNEGVGPGNLGTSKAFADFSPEFCHSAWDFEGVLLAPGDLL